MKRCLDCGSEKIVDGKTSRKAYLMLRVNRDPDAKLFKGGVDSEVRARRCTDCGFTSFYATDLEEIRSIKQARS